jgi:SAM-dependent methyltransferase
MVGGAGLPEMSAPESSSSLPPAYFDDLYRKDPDPWGFRTRDYERHKYEDTVAALEGRRFASAIEVGCSIGELTARLAPSCDKLLGVDIAEAPLELARVRNAATPHVRFARMQLPQQRPEGAFDLIVLSEVLYYFGLSDLEAVARWTCQALAPGGVALLVHWLGETPDYPCTGEEAVEAFLAFTQPTLTTDRRWRRELYRLDRLARRSSAKAAPPGGFRPAAGPA